MKYTIVGPITEALTHLAAVGAALLAEEASGQTAFVGWDASPGSSSVAQVEIPDDADLGAIVVEHAARHAQPESWVMADHPHEGGSIGTFSPRVKPSTSTPAARALLDARQQELDAAHQTWLDLAFIGALGEPASWLAKEPDRGASRWEMKTRNNGQEFVSDRLRPLAQTVSTWTPAEALDGLTGQACRDDVGKASSTWRAATGLRRPGPTDNALAWCALWGIAATTLIPRADGLSQSSGSFPRRGIHPRQMALPIFDHLVTPARWASVLASRAFDDVAFADGDTKAARVWLAESGAIGIVRFPTEVVGNSMGPERRVLGGVLELVEA